MKYPSWTGSLVGIGLIAAAGTCSPYGAYCEDGEACVGGNDTDIDACLVEMAAGADEASAYDCTTEYDAWWECLSDKVHCDNDNWTSGTECSSKSESLGKCKKDASGHK
ncbi:MAG: hypothetical protein HY744_32380 [Deltaproteobacteria bacterium]|nr:hypothetical protein [Deltaproteobacteria bacterium]